MNSTTLPSYLSSPIEQNLIKDRLSKNEVEAVNLANVFKNLITLANKLCDGEKIPINKFSHNYDYFRSQALSFLEKIHKEALENKCSEINNYYYLYFLQQISRWNMYFNTLGSITDNRKNSVATCWTGDASFISVLESSLKKHHIDITLKAISHPLLNQPTDLTLEVEINNNEKIFGEPFVYENEGDSKKRFYYNKKNTVDGEEHQDRLHYPNANLHIGSATQFSNLKCTLKHAASSLLTLFSPANTNFGQGTNEYFKNADLQLHKEEKRLFKSAMEKIQSAKPLSPEEITLLHSGKYYRYNSPAKFKVPPQKNKKEISDPYDYQIMHIGHAAEYVTINDVIPLKFCIDPLHHQTGTGENIAFEAGAKLLYGRMTIAGFKSDEYPGNHIVLISHNHFDHLCEKSLKEAFLHSNVLFIVPAGDAKHLKKFGFTNIIELGSWNDTVKVTLKDKNGNQSTYEIGGFPANHASNRSTTDYFECFFTGYRVRKIDSDKLMIFTGDTAVLRDNDFSDFSNYLLTNNFSISSACIAHGPDRPRSWMKCTHQSTADAVTMHSNFNFMNASVLLLHNKRDYLSFEDAKQASCYGIGYHQGCFRLGLLSYSDVDTTLLRMLSVLKSLGEMSVRLITENVLKNNIFYYYMDQFEQEALNETLKIYRRLAAIMNDLSAAQVVELITSHLCIPQPGYKADFSKDTPYEGFIYDYDRLIVNKSPQMNEYQGDEFSTAYEYFIYDLDSKLYYPEVTNKIELIKAILLKCLSRDTFNPLASSKQYVIKELLEQCKSCADEDIEKILGECYLTLFPQQDEGIRDEGHTHTGLSILGGLLHFSDFRQKIYDRYCELNNIKDLTMVSFK